VIITHGAGLDVHKKTVMACRVIPDPTGQQADGSLEVQEFGTTTAALLALADWLTVAGLTHVAMESTGEYWKPVYNILEDDFTVLLVNAAHVKRVPGRKTDKTDARWLAKLMRYGLLQGSFIPPEAQRDVRDLTRYRTTLVQERSREVKRVPGVLERANITLASVATEVMGVSGRAILAALVEVQADSATMAELAKGRMRSKIPLLEQALTGQALRTLGAESVDLLVQEIDMCQLHGQQLPMMRAHQAGEAAAPEASGSLLTFTQAVTLLDTIPGVDQRGGELLVAEWGIDMAHFGTAACLSAWSGVAPGNDESVGKPRSGKTR
jgi:transposase